MIKGAVKIFFSVFAIFLATRFFLFVPKSLGLLNFGEMIFFIVAFHLDPLSATAVGALSFPLADYFLGYSHYMYSSMPIKALVGFTVCFISRRSSNKPLLYSMHSLLLAALFTLCGILLYSGIAYLGYVEKLRLGEAVMLHGGVEAHRIYLPFWLWIMAGLALTICLHAGREKNWIGLSVLAGATITALTYFLYESMILPSLYEVKIDALANMPLNFGQTIVCGSFAILMTKAADYLKSKRFAVKKP